MFWDKRLLYKGKSREKYNEVINILELNIYYFIVFFS